MFGDKYIICNGTLSVDTKRRITIPKKGTGIEKSDENLAIKYKEDHIEIYSGARYIAYIDEINEKIANCQDKETLYELKLQLMEALVDEIQTIDVAGRIVIPKNLQTTEDSSVYYHGFYDHLRIYTSEEVCRESIEIEKQQLEEKTEYKTKKKGYIHQNDCFRNM